MHSKVKSEQCFAVTGARRVVVLQSKFKIRMRTDSKGNDHLTPQELKQLH